MKKVKVVGFVGVGLAMLLGGGAWGAEKIAVGGASGMTPLAQELAKAYGARHKGETIEVEPGTSSSGGIRSLIQGKLDIALSSRTLTPDEAKQGLKLVEFARVRVVFAVNSSVPIENLTSDQICGIYSGRIKNWKEVGGPNEPIFPLSRPSGESDPQIIRANVGCFKDLKEAEGVLILLKAEDMFRALSTKRGTLGMTTMIDVQRGEGKIKPLAIDGIAPTVENVAAGRYKLIRNFFFVTKEKPSPVIQRFIDFVKGGEGEKVIVANKALPVK